MPVYLFPGDVPTCKRSYCAGWKGVILLQLTLITMSDFEATSCLCWIQGLAEDQISHILPHELKRTRLNVLCFMENLPENNSLHASRRGSQSSQRQRVASANNMSGRKSSGSSLTDSESGRSSGLPPVSPSASDTIRAADRYARTRNDPRRASYRGQTRYNVDTDELR